MQDILTTAIEFVIVSHVALTVVNFLSRFARKTVVQPIQPIQSEEVISQPADELPTVEPVNEEVFFSLFNDLIGDAETFFIPESEVIVLPEIECPIVAADVVNHPVIAPYHWEVNPQPKEVSIWSQLSPAELRKECTAKQIKWRNAHGKNKHLKKEEMIAALNAI